MVALLAGLAMPATAEPVAPFAARFTDATDRYPHNVLGELTGFGGLEATLAGGTTVRLMLPDNRVFERDCGAGLELLLPTADWRRIAGVRLADGRLTAEDLGAFVGAGALEALLSCPG